MDLHDSSDLLRLLGDPTRLRLMRVLSGDELTVAELVRATRLPQSRVSTHLGRLREAGLVRDRRSGSSCFYALNDTGMTDDCERLWSTLRESTDDALLREDVARAREIVSARGESWADSVAGQMERHYSPGRTWETALRGLLGLVELGDVLDVASGDGAIAELLAPRARSLTCVDLSPRVVAAGRARLEHLPTVEFRVGDMHELPLAERSHDQVLLMHALSYAEAPGRVLDEAARVLRPGGALIGVTLAAHAHEAAARQYSHVQLGFTPAELRADLERAGFDVSLCEVTSRERRAPHFEVITLHARRRTDS
jgi:ArsR family transcriptional regulator